MFAGVYNRFWENVLWSLNLQCLPPSHFETEWADFGKYKPSVTCLTYTEVPDTVQYQINPPKGWVKELIFYHDYGCYAHVAVICLILIIAATLWRCYQWTHFLGRVRHLSTLVILSLIIIIVHHKKSFWLGFGDFITWYIENSSLVTTTYIDQ